MDRKNYFESLAKVYVNDNRTGYGFCGPLVISRRDSYSQHKDMFLCESDFYYPNIGTFRHSMVELDVA